MKIIKLTKLGGEIKQEIENPARCPLSPLRGWGV